MYQKSIRMLVVDDSVFYRGIISDVLKKLPNVEYLGFATNGESALSKITDTKPDLITLDVEMPGMNGIEVLKQIRRSNPETHVVMISAATEESARHTIDALDAGALDFIQKPSGGTAEQNERQLYRDLKRVVSIVETKLILRHGKGIADTNKGVEHPHQNRYPDQYWDERSKAIEIVVIGVSTGGPQALPEVLGRLPNDFHLPIIVVQHLPALFVNVLVESLNTKSNLKVEIAKNNHEIENGVVYIAPGGVHTKIVSRRGHTRPITLLTHDPAENFCRPSVDYLFRSTAQVCRDKTLAIIMTGMGKDGVEGMKLLKDCGASTIAQDEKTSTVFGMPMEAINAGVVDKIVPLNEIAKTIINRSSTKR